jgi:hypothetical protein
MNELVEIAACGEVQTEFLCEIIDLLGDLSDAGLGLCAAHNTEPHDLVTPQFLTNHSNITIQ